MMSLTNVNIRCEVENAKKRSLAAARYSSFDDFCNTRRALLLLLLFDDARRQARDDGGSAYALPFFFFRYKKMSLFFVPIRAPFLSHFKRIKYRREKTRAHILLLYSKLDETNTNAERTTTIIIALSSKGQKKKKVVVVVVSKGGQKKTTKRRG